jgi:integrase
VIKQQLQRGSITPTKTHGWRTLALPVVVAEALRKHASESKVLSLRGWVFTTSQGTPIDKHNFNRSLWRPLLQRAGVAHRGFHTTRHSCASFLLGAGIDLKVVQSILGHSSITVTADIYAHVMPELHRQAADAIESALMGPGVRLPIAGNLSS